MADISSLLDHLKLYLVDCEVSFDDVFLFLSIEEIEIIVKALEHLQEVENG